jgi:hypothetical protein
MTTAVVVFPEGVELHAHDEHTFCPACGTRGLWHFGDDSPAPGHVTDYLCAACGAAVSVQIASGVADAAAHTLAEIRAAIAEPSA